MKSLTGKKILIGVTGGISAYKTLDLVSILIKMGNEVHVIMTPNAEKYCPKDAISVLSEGHLIEEFGGETKHITEAKWCDMFILVPATANTIAKIVNGMCDNFLTTTILALPKDKLRIVCPAMNTVMYESVFTTENIKKLEQEHWQVISPVVGLLACGDYGIGKLPKVSDIIDELKSIVSGIKKWNFPLELKYRGTTVDSYSFLDYDISKEVELNMYPHVGAFGIRRRHDVHKGIDIYATEGTPVYAVEKGTVVEICPFTGPSAGYPWWNDTDAVYVKGNFGIVVYGEISIYTDKIKMGLEIDRGDLIGHVKRVITVDKGRPTSMLHLELHDEFTIHTEKWDVGKTKPRGLLDPTLLLLKSSKC